jgi:hypothetical protein
MACTKLAVDAWQELLPGHLQKASQHLTWSTRLNRVLCRKVDPVMCQMEKDPSRHRRSMMKHVTNAK